MIDDFEFLCHLDYWPKTVVDNSITWLFNCYVRDMDIYAHASWEENGHMQVAAMPFLMQ